MGDDPEGRRQRSITANGFARCRGAYSGDDRAGDRRAHRALLHPDRIKARLAFLETQGAELARRSFSIDRVPTFCSGCPHNTSTNVPEGSRALAGIGCHYIHGTPMPERHTGTFYPDGRRRRARVGQAPFTTEDTFANLGDGTYFHSGLFRDPPGGGGKGEHHLQDPLQRRSGDDWRTAARRRAFSTEDRAPARGRGVYNIVVVTDGTARDYGPADLSHGVPVRHRDELDAIQRDLRQTRGCPR